MYFSIISTPSPCLIVYSSMHMVALFPFDMPQCDMAHYVCVCLVIYLVTCKEENLPAVVHHCMLRVNVFYAVLKRVTDGGVMMLKKGRDVVRDGRKGNVGK